jgi:hypothetical protein
MLNTEDHVRKANSTPVRRHLSLLVASAALFLALAFPAAVSMPKVQAAPAAAEERPFVVEYYPVLKKEIELGRILKVFAVAPRYHSTEDGRWDYRTTIIFKNAEVAHDNFDTPTLLKQLFPDQATYKLEEQHRFEILEAHWDVPIKDVDLDAH